MQRFESARRLHPSSRRPTRLVSGPSIATSDVRRLAGVVGIIVFTMWTGTSPRARAEEILNTDTGRDVQTPRPFTVRDRWEIRWEPEGQIPQMTVHEASGKLVDLAANQSAPGSGSSFQPRGGMYYLKINGLGAWTVSIVQLD